MSISGGEPARGVTRGKGDGAPLSAGEAWIPVSSLSALAHGLISGCNGELDQVSRERMR